MRRMFPQKKIGIRQVKAARLLTYDFVLKWSGTLEVLVNNTNLTFLSLLYKINIEVS